MDQQLLFLINREWTSPGLDRLMATVSSWPVWWPLLLLAGAALVVWGGFHGRAFVAVAGLAVGINDGVVVNLAKDWVGRPRPHEALEGVRTLDLARATPRLLAAGLPLRENLSTARLVPPRGNSFPSGHASNSFALAAVCALFFRRWGWLAFLPAALVAYSRVYVGAHWPLDVAVSIFLGAGMGILAAVFCEWAWRRAGPRYFPRLALAHPSLLRP
ncbi:MAG: phosphatase PAP2 family protein [Terrimicrobiaceae bacterium]|nr:phosphatase PAP2 family protein [Terrimicrobiaceae bacterium]